MTIGSIAVVIWLVTRKVDDVVSITGPQLEVTGEKTVKSVKVSEYAFRKMEYQTTQTEYRFHCKHKD